MVTGFEDMDTSVFKTASSKYLPREIQYLLIAESPPAFSSEKPVRYFYFPDVPRADMLFYSIIKAIYDHDFVKGVDNRNWYLRKLSDDGYFLIDSVDYPINKTKEGTDISNSFRKQIILLNKFRFIRKLKTLMKDGYINSDTKVILIKETVFKVYSKCELITVANDQPLHFPSYVGDLRFVQGLRNMLHNKT
jgi:hypothetical protein